jgi:hypothetical protein
VSFDHRRRQIDKGSISRSRERPPDQKRERGPGGDRTADLKNTDNNNGNAHSNNLSERRAQENRRLRRQQYAQRIWPLGDRVLFELVNHIADRFGPEDEVDRLLDRFAGLSPEILRAVGADRLPERPLHLVWP